MNYEYQMSEEMAKAIIGKQKGNKQKILCDFVNSQLGLKGICIKVVTD